MVILKKAIHILADITYILIILYAVVCIPILFQYHPVVVLSGSMEPTLKIGSVIYYKKVPFKTLKKDDIITFQANKNELVTHRIVKIENNLIETKGDANKVSDVNKISNKTIKGKVGKIIIPYIGYYIKTVNDNLKIIVIATTIILISEFLFSNKETIDTNSIEKEIRRNETSKK